MAERLTQDRSTLLAQARAASDQLRLGEALAAYERMLEADPDDLVALLGTVRVLMRMRRQDEALEAANGAIARFPEDHRALAVMGSLQFLMDNNTEAIETLEQAIELEDQDPEAHVILAQALADEGQHDRADQELVKAQEIVEAMPDEDERARWLAMTWHARTYVQLAQGKNSDAMESAQEVIARKDANPYAACLAYSNLGILQMRSRHYDDAIDYLEQALDLNPFFCRAGHALGRLLIVRKRYERAAEVMGQVIEHMPAVTAGARYTYAVALAKCGQREQALEQYRLALASGLGGANSLMARWQLLWLNEWGRYAIIGVLLAALLVWIVLGEPSAQALTFIGLLALLLVLQRVFGQRRR